MHLSIEETYVNNIFNGYKLELTKGLCENRITEQIHNEYACSICHECINEWDKISIPCGHEFHSECLYTWFMRTVLTGPKCPLCRSSYTTTSANRNYLLLENNYIFCTILNIPHKRTYTSDFLFDFGKDIVRQERLIKQMKKLPKHVIERMCSKVQSTLFSLEIIKE